MALLEAYSDSYGVSRLRFLRHELYISIPTSYLIAFDGSPTSEKLIEKAINTPLLFGLDSHLVMVDGFGAKSAVFEKAAIKLKNAGITVIQR